MLGFENKEVFKEIHKINNNVMMIRAGYVFSILMYAVALVFVILSIIKTNYLFLALFVFFGIFGIFIMRKIMMTPMEYIYTLFSNRISVYEKRMYSQRQILDTNISNYCTIDVIGSIGEMSNHKVKGDIILLDRKTKNKVLFLLGKKDDRKYFIAPSDAFIEEMRERSNGIF